MKRFGFSYDSWRSAVNRGDILPRSRLIPLEELLVKGRPTSRGHLKRRLIEAGLKEDGCEKCGINEWWGRPLSAQLHHRNGDGTDNRLFNLEFLCPNCHAQTENWGGRNVKRGRKPDLKLIEGGSEEEEEAA
jgi:5-methylcytosine-specific restriction endonuclease McrA